MSDLIDYIGDDWGGDGIIHATTDYEINSDYLDNGYRQRYNQGKRCMFPGCDEPITNGAKVCQLHAMSYRKAKADVQRLLAYKARRDRVLEDMLDAVFAEYTEGRIVGRAQREVKNAAD